ncbi:malonyl-CoA decarboxylase [Aliamphritea ceti]|uniref:malonyl-CoA decarboxylase n=1 Tax=Aliamphritea ceti TaxID=1524258 RepID=UPI0021C34D5F|nr:malonyl-CoA decarboxylase [Aliamphritea ceti]
MLDNPSSLWQKTVQHLMPLWREALGNKDSLDSLTLTPDLETSDHKQLLTWIDACIDGAGDVAARNRTAQLGRCYLELSETGRVTFFTLLCQKYDIQEQKLTELMQAWQDADSDSRQALTRKLRQQLEPPRMVLLRQFNELPEGVKFLVDMRAELLKLSRQHLHLKPLEEDLKRLLTNWFDVGLLQLEEITWHSGADLLEKLIEYEAVHEIQSWNDLKNRLDSDRRCFAFFHPNMPNEPLIFVEVALVEGMSGNVQALLDEDAPLANLNQADSAIFYSISNTQKGLRGISLGNFLIKQVVNQLQHDFPQLKQFATLSPVPGFTDWLDNLSEAEQQTLAFSGNSEQLRQQLLQADEAGKEALEAQIKPLALAYFTQAKHPRYERFARDSVAHFHLTNGAQLARINWLADQSEKGLKQSLGLMVNYLYELPQIEARSQGYTGNGEIALSAALNKQKK